MKDISPSTNSACGLASLSLGWSADMPEVHNTSFWINCGRSPAKVRKPHVRGKVARTLAPANLVADRQQIGHGSETEV
jgi:hypothetical protein